MLPEDVLQFWFTRHGPQQWYNGGDGFDAEIRAKFENMCLETAAHYKKRGTHIWENAPETCLALLLVFDQFPRNMYRGTQAAFAFDVWALEIAQRAVEKGYDLKTEQSARAFFYMPYMHAEDLTVQDTCVGLIDGRIDNENTLFHAKEHRKVIAKFGRFPYRNTALKRTNTSAETLFLNTAHYAP